MIEMLGAERLFYGKLGAATPFTLRLDATLPPPQAGDWLHLAFNPLHLHRFDAQTGQRL
jgi:sn-glycerol 3-phosphate transport system ATP-binding protein